MNASIVNEPRVALHMTTREATLLRAAIGKLKFAETVAAINTSSFMSFGNRTATNMQEVEEFTNSLMTALDKVL